MAVPRGGIQIGESIARQAATELMMYPVARVRLPCSDVAVGAIADLDRDPEIDSDLVNLLGASREDVADSVIRARAQFRKLQMVYGEAPRPSSVRSRDILLIDDAIATGATVRAALTHLRRLGPNSIVVATPVISDFAYREVEQLADDLIYLHRATESLFCGARYYPDRAAGK